MYSFGGAMRRVEKGVRGEVECSGRARTVKAATS